jgi:hypothetical protein
VYTMVCWTLRVFCVCKLGFVAEGDILMRCPDDISCFLSVVRFRNEI